MTIRRLFGPNPCKPRIASYGQGAAPMSWKRSASITASAVVVWVGSGMNLYVAAKRILFFILLVSIPSFSQNTQNHPPILVCKDHWWNAHLWNPSGQVCYPEDQNLKKQRTSTSIKKFCAENPADGTILYGSGVKVSCHDWLEANPPKERQKK